MFKTLFARMLVSYLAVAMGVLVILGFMATGIFRSHYINEVKSELTRESNEINRILLEEYIDTRKQPIARERLFAIVRQYGAMIQFRFDDPKYGSVDIVDEENMAKWQACGEADLSAISEQMKSSPDFYSYNFDFMSEYTDIRTLTIIRPLQYGDGKRMGVLLLHYDMQSIYQALDSLYLDVFMSALIAVLITVPVAFIITKYTTSPVSHINDVVTDFSHGRYETRVVVRREDELGRLGASFNAMADQVAGLEKARRDFVANVSHELRSPLTSIRGFLEAMEDGTIPEDEHQKYIEIVLDETRRITGMVNDLLDIARIESGQYKLNVISFDINELIGRVLITFEARILAKGLDVDVRLSDEPLYVVADRDRIGQVLHNLIDNAIKYAKAEGGILTVESSVNRQNVTVRVGDNGTGIPKQDIPHIFDRFYKVEKAHTYGSRSGTGLGLSIAKLIIDQHNCEIKVKSDEKGTDFIFTLKKH